VVFTLPAPIADIAYQNKAAIYNILFKASAETLTTIAADPKHLGARVGITSVLHTWGSAMTHHPHVHMIVPGGGISLDGERWVACRPGFFLPVRVLSRLFRRLFLERLLAAHQNNRLKRRRVAARIRFANHLVVRDRVILALQPIGGDGQGGIGELRTGLTIVDRHRRPVRAVVLIPDRGNPYDDVAELVAVAHLPDVFH
jgi:hypothetical protein